MPIQSVSSFRRAGLAGFAILGTLISASPALAHETGLHHGLVGGMLHPLGGLDHLVAMLAVGLWAGAMDKARSWFWPAAFVGGMALGLASLAGIAVPAWLAALAEPGIVVSLIGLGLFLLLAIRVSAQVGIAVLLVAGLFHGLAHASESGGTDAVQFALGVLLMTSVLHALAVIIARQLRTQQRGPAILRASGGASLATAAIVIAGWMA